jgi:hypothetical protein
LLTLNQRSPSQILAVEMQQVERDEPDRNLATRTAIRPVCKIRDATA